MHSHAQAFGALCHSIIKHADPQRGEKTPPVNFRHLPKHDKPIHTPVYLWVVVALVDRIDKMPEIKIARAHNSLVGSVLNEASVRFQTHNGAIPPYFEQALDSCSQFQLEAFQNWLVAQPNFDGWNQMLKLRINLIFYHHLFASLPA